ncbi:MAG TPA: hypothetical protein VF698_02170 [Thermoanaerobaculia bacterium]|jgi:hypothetical protein
MKRILGVLCAWLLWGASAAVAGQVDFKGWHYPNAASCDAAKAEFEAKYKTYGYLTTECKKQNPKAQLGPILSFSCFMGNGKNGFTGGAIVTATVACGAACVPPPSVCPAGKTKLGDFVSPGGKWGTGTYAVCLEGPQTVTSAWCAAAYFPKADHKCDDYSGYSTETAFNGKKYCVYERTNSTYYKALLLETPPVVVTVGGLHYPDVSDCELAKKQFAAAFKTIFHITSACSAKSPGSKPVELVGIECKQSGKGTVLSATAKCQ